jgi:hypothetical protein
MLDSREKHASNNEHDQDNAVSSDMDVGNQGKIL